MNGGGGGWCSGWLEERVNTFAKRRRLDYVGRCGVVLDAMEVVMICRG